ncbi:MAG: Ig-like domain-containing protein [SAR202 cluster bacterium]|nr:Ig-like domain-containing protein [SAR202 cluster bacterium]
MANDSDVEDTVLRVSLVGIKTPHGLVSTTTKNGHDAALYEPDFGFFGSDVFWYTITDTDGGSASAQVSMDVTSNRPPQAINDTATTSVGQAVVMDVVSNDVDPDGDPLILTQVFNPRNGAFATTTHTPNRVIFSPDASFVGYGSFEYMIGDGRSDFDTAVATVAVGVNLPPVAKSDFATASPGTTVSIDVLANDSDPNGDTLTIGSFTQPPLGSVQLVASSTLNYTAPLGNNLEEAFRYTASDSRGGLTNATVTVQVIKNDVPLEIRPSHAIVPFGGEFDLVVWTNVISTQQVSGVELFLNYDSSKLQVVSGSAATGSPIKVTGITTHLNLELHNSVDNSSGTVDYAAGSLGPFPVGPFPVVSVRFKAVGVANSTGTPVTISLIGPRNSNVALGENVIKGEHGDAQIVVQVPRFKANVRLQGQLRPAPQGWRVPISVELFVPGTATSTSPPASRCETVTTYSDSGLSDHPTTGTQAAEFECDGVAGTFDVVIDSTHTLPKLIQNVAIPSTQGTLHFGTLFEGDVDDNGLVNVLDFTRLVASFLECNGDAEFDAGADFDRDGCVRILDFTLLADTFQKPWAEL